MSSEDQKTLVVVGASHAGCHIAEAARVNGWEGKIVLVGDEPYMPYHRPPLSKDFLAGKKSVEQILIKPEKLYEKHRIECRLNTRVTRIDRENKLLELEGGETLAYDKLGLALGARPRVVPIPGAETKGTFYLRTIDDIEGIRAFVDEGKKAVIVGGGYIGLETAAALRKLGVEVTVVEMAERILQRVTTESISEFYTRVHTEEGVNILTSAGVAEIKGDETVSGVVLSNGDELAADLVIIGAGILPNIEMAEEAGLKVEGGIVVDEFGVTSDPDIVASGDCVWHHNAFYDRWIRLESVQNAHDQAKSAGASVCGVQKTYKQLPWFWSDQYDMKLQIAGLSQGFDDVVIRGDISSGRTFAAFYFKGDTLLAVDAVNMPVAYMVARKALTDGIAMDKEKVADESIELKALLK
jgi:3-phenylpropionate/trans-cinnamate dioxygenase ferredoxin reductase subunit